MLDMLDLPWLARNLRIILIVIAILRHLNEITAFDFCLKNVCTDRFRLSFQWEVNNLVFHISWVEKPEKLYIH